MTKTLLLKLLATKKLQINGGHIRLEGTEFNLLPSVFVSSLTDQFNNNDELHKLYLLSWFWGFEFSKYVAQDLGLDTADAIYSVGMNLIENMGFGLYQTDDYYPGRYTRFKIEDNPYHNYLDLSRFDGPIDVLISGMMAGGGCHVHDAVCQNVEIRCKAQGDNVCEFLTGTKEELQERDIWETAKQRHHLDDVLAFQESVFNDYTRDQSGTFLRRLSELLEEI